MHVQAEKIVEYIEKYIKDKNFPPFGWHDDQIPDYQFLIEVYHFIAKDDPLGVKFKTIEDDK